jgi:zinc ribbon protein
MHCPNCGTKASTGQKYCRACGFGLEKVEQLVADQRAAATEQITVATGRFSDDWLRKFEKWAARALFAIGGVLGGLMLWAIIAKMMIEKGKIIEGGIVLLILTGAVLAVFLGYLDSERKKSASIQSNQQHRPSGGEETAKMLSEPNAEMATSVTEQTTARLEEKLESRR